MSLDTSNQFAVVGRNDGTVQIMGAPLLCEPISHEQAANLAGWIVAVGDCYTEFQDTLNDVRTPRQQLTVEETLNVWKMVSNSNHGDFLQCFARTMQIADHQNFALLERLSRALIDKYNLEAEAEQKKWIRARPGEEPVYA